MIPDVFLKCTVPSAALQVLPNSGHTINIEEPAAFNVAVSDFLAQVESGRWPMRDARTQGGPNDRHALTRLFSGWIYPIASDQSAFSPNCVQHPIPTGSSRSWALGDAAR